MLNHEVKTEHYTSTFDIPCSIFCGSLLRVGQIRTKPGEPHTLFPTPYTLNLKPCEAFHALARALES